MMQFNFRGVLLVCVFAWCVACKSDSNGNKDSSTTQDTNASTDSSNTADSASGDTGNTDTAAGDGAGDGQTQKLVDQCKNSSDEALFAQEGFGTALTVAVKYCAAGFNTCLSCVLDDKCDLPACVSKCIKDYKDNDSSDADVDAALKEVRDSGLTAGCAGCSATITQCIALNGCTQYCLSNSDSCECKACACSKGCPAAFAECSGRPAYLDCSTIPASPEACAD